MLQNQLSEKPRLHLFAFDLMFLQGLDVMQRPLEERRRLLHRKVMPLLPDTVRFSETLEASAAELREAIREMSLEGIVAKRRSSHYEPGRRTGSWQMRINQAAEFVIGGYIPGSSTFDSILVGYYEGRNLLYAARIRSGFTPALRLTLFKKFAKLVVTECPFRNLPERSKGRWGDGLTAEDKKKCRWLQTRIVATVEFLEWTPEKRLRHPKFVSVREDKTAREVTRDQ